MVGVYGWKARSVRVVPSISLYRWKPPRPTRLYRHEAVFFSRPFFFLETEHCQRLDQPLAGFRRSDRRLRELFRQGFERAVKALLVLGDFFRSGFGRVGRLLNFTLVENVDRTTAAHDRQFHAGPNQ